jgi:hypothetical protein
MTEVDDSLSIFYRLTKGDCCLATLSVSRSCLLGNPFVLPKNTRQAGLVSSGLLCILTDKQKIILFDRRRGAEIATHDLSDILHGSHGDLVTDVRRSRLAVLFLDEEEFTVALSSVHFGNDSQDLLTAVQGDNFSLAAGLASSFSSPKETHSLKLGTSNLVAFNIEAGSRTESNPHKIAIQKGLQMFTDAVGQLKCGANETADSSFLLDAFESALDSIRVHLVPACSKNKKKVFPKNGKTINGVYKRDRKPSRTVDFIIEQVRVIFTTSDKQCSQKNSTCLFAEVFMRHRPNNCRLYLL